MVFDSYFKLKSPQEPMGVDIREIVSGKKTTLEGLSGKKVAVDAYNAI